MNFLFHISIVALKLWPATTQAQEYSSSSGLAPDLTTVKNTPELSIFYSLIASSGGSSGIPSSEWEERFDNPNQCLNYTVLAPVNDAFENVTADELAVLKSLQVFSTLNTLLLNHILPGDYQEGTSSTIQAIGGYSYTFSTDGSMTTNEDLQTSEVEIPVQARFLTNARIPAGNGAVYKIDRANAVVIERSSAIEQRPGTMSDIIKSDGELSTVYNVLKVTMPGIFVELAADNSENGSNSNVTFLAAGNAAFDVLPEGAVDRALQNSNAGLTRGLLRAGYGNLAPDSSTLQTHGGLNVTIQGGRANNAKVDRRVCADNGCVWQLGRFLDPVYGVL